VSASELLGVSPAFINSLPRKSEQPSGADLLILGCKSPQYVAVMEGTRTERELGRRKKEGRRRVGGERMECRN
jgi:hypothetical protein